MKWWPFGRGITPARGRKLTMELLTTYPSHGMILHVGGAFNHFKFLSSFSQRAGLGVETSFIFTPTWG